MLRGSGFDIIFFLSALSLFHAAYTGHESVSVSLLELYGFALTGEAKRNPDFYSIEKRRVYDDNRECYFRWELDAITYAPA